MTAKGREPSDAEMLASSEEIDVFTVDREAGRVTARKRVEREPVSELVEREVEHADVERVAASEDDSGEVLALDDGSVSIPVFEERLVVEKRRVVTERVVVRKRQVLEAQRVEADLAKERVEISADPEIADRVHEDNNGPGAGTGGGAG